jgi:hypothetical protein|tara:strand:- start:1002 stop:1484 length:483 start_codon:yes stop_codon:yes gene_type:complete
MKIKVVDNFLPAIAFEKLSTSVLSYDFPWYYTDKIVYDGDNEFQYFHRFYDTFDGKSNQYQLLTDTLNCIDGYKLRRAKANSTTRKFFRRRSLYHTDFENVITGILYINTNNGGTKFKNSSFVKSVANRYVEFDSNIEHAGVRCTDQKRRVVINFNFTRL